MAEGSDVNYWYLIFIGAMLLGAVILFAIIRNRKSNVSQNTTEQGTRDVYAEEQRLHEREPGSGL
jgi:hypothetical protein